MMALLVATAFFTGCASHHHTCDGRDNSEMCELHHRMMSIVTLPNPNMKTPPSDEYLGARIRGFVHSKPFYLPPECTEVVVYICEECLRNERMWRDQHPAGR